MKKNKQALTRFNRLVVAIYEPYLSQKKSKDLEALITIELIEDYLLFLQSKGLQVESDYRKEIENYTQNKTEKKELKAFYRHLEKFF